MCFYGGGFSGGGGGGCPLLWPLARLASALQRAGKSCPRATSSPHDLRARCVQAQGEGRALDLSPTDWRVFCSTPTRANSIESIEHPASGATGPRVVSCGQRTRINARNASLCRENFRPAIAPKLASPAGSPAPERSQTDQVSGPTTDPLGREMELEIKWRKQQRSRAQEETGASTTLVARC